MTRRANQFTPVIDRFWSAVDKRGSDECWPWTGRIQHEDDDYGTLNIGGKPKRAHRMSWEIANGRSVPDGLVVDHLCFNKRCVNPAHLDAVTVAENTRRWAATITHCPRNHTYDDANTRVDKNGKRVCRKCAVTKSAKFTAKNRGRYPKVVCANGHTSNHAQRSDGSFGACRKCGSLMLRYGTQPVSRKRPTRAVGTVKP